MMVVHPKAEDGGIHIDVLILSMGTSLVVFRVNILDERLVEVVLDGSIRISFRAIHDHRRYSGFQ